MDELKPCPMCINKFFCMITGDACQIIRPSMCEAFKKAYEVGRRAAPENKALTREQLRKMQGQPVYIVYSRFPEDNEWKILKSVDEEPDDDGDTGVRFSDKDWENLEGYGQGWIAYARKPEGSETHGASN